MDWPHHDFDHPRSLARLPLTPEQRSKIMGENALSLFKLPMPESLTNKEKQRA
ncbi:hypothetical protein [Bradyrhizobium sp. BEA-2-5]|uniref:hypothetical protein n=1 Tax=Bradyrhizobium sp. BEA-2-5 TaxID=3080015 RepID=UPI00397C86C2